MRKVILMLILLLSSVAVLADGSDPMPLCRHVDSHGHPCVLPPSAR